MASNTVTCSFVVDRDIYNAYKSIVSRNGENVKGNPYCNTKLNIKKYFIKPIFRH